MSGITPGGIRYPDAASRANNLGPELKRMAEDIEAYVQEHGDGHFRGILTGGSLDDLATGIYWVATSAAATALGLPEAWSGPLEIIRQGGAGQAVWRPVGDVPRVWRTRRTTTGWGTWWCDQDRPIRLTDANTTTWDALQDGLYYTDLAPVQTKLGLPARVGLIRKYQHPTIAYGAAEMIEWVSTGKPPRWVIQKRTDGWQSWLPEDELTHLTLADTANADRNVLQIEHYGDGTGRPNGQTYGIDIHNYEDARQAVVIHQYSGAREAVRIDNTDQDASIYINNTQNLNYNPDGTGEGAAFLKLHPYNMGNFLDFAYLMDDLTWLNDTDKTWSFQSKTGSIVEFKNAAGAVVGHVSQDGLQLRDTGVRDITSLATGISAGTIKVIRSGKNVNVELRDITLTNAGQQILLQLPLGFRPSLEQRANTTRYWTSELAPVVLRITGAGDCQFNYDAKTTGLYFANFNFLTGDTFPTTLPGTPA